MPSVSPRRDVEADAVERVHDAAGGAPAGRRPATVRRVRSAWTGLRPRAAASPCRAHAARLRPATRPWRQAGRPAAGAELHRAAGATACSVRRRRRSAGRRRSRRAGWSRRRRLPADRAQQACAPRRRAAPSPAGRACRHGAAAAKIGSHRTGLDDPAGIHDRHAVAGLGDDAEIVGHEDHRSCRARRAAAAAASGSGPGS